jgi:MtN3 and saliva related transmembrane protein
VCSAHNSTKSCKNNKNYLNKRILLIEIQQNGVKFGSHKEVCNTKQRKTPNYFVIKGKTMEQSILYTICGYVASIGLILGYLPQAITTIRTGNTDGISMPAFLMMAVGAFAFMLQGLLHRPNIIWSMLITNAVTCTCSCIIFAIKVYNKYSRK